MIGYRRYSFARAHALLQTLRANLDDLITLKELQKLLLNEIIRAEEKIRELKNELRAIKERVGSVTARRSSYLENRIEGFRQCGYIWRCFGDAIAFLYMDKFALKHSFYNTENIKPKQDAGFISGKNGLENELAILDSALAHNVPAILVDLTNTIRHGDICLMGESDPYLIEVKTSKKLDSRGKKQQRNLEKLRTFYETDNSDELRGFPRMVRQTYAMSERTYVDQINECITEAYKDGYAIREPERGLYYIALTQGGPGSKQAIGSLPLKDPLVFLLNQVKSTRTWSPYLPFILTIENKEHLWNFIRGNLYIVVLVELDALCQIAIDKGYEARFDLGDESYPLRVDVPVGDDTIGISMHILSRIGREFVSPEWVVLTSIDMAKRSFEALAAENSDAPAA